LAIRPIVQGYPWQCYQYSIVNEQLSHPWPPLLATLGKPAWLANIYCIRRAKVTQCLPIIFTCKINGLQTRVVYRLRGDFGMVSGYFTLTSYNFTSLAK